MTHRPLEFTIEKSRKDDRFYVHLEHGNGKNVFTSPHGRASLASAATLADSVWLGIRDQVGLTDWPPTPYSKRSLLPRARRSS